MCGRFTQYRTAIEYLEALRYNVPPRSRVLVFFGWANRRRLVRLRDSRTE